MSTVYLPGLCAWRRKAGLKQLKLAEMAGLTPETVCRYEKQYRPASIMSAQRLAKLLGVALDVLTGGAPVPGSGPTQPNLTTMVYLPGLRAWRKKAGLTQVQLAELAGGAPETLSRYERQHRPASIRSAQRLAELLGVALKVLTDGVP